MRVINADLLEDSILERIPEKEMTQDQIDMLEIVCDAPYVHLDEGYQTAAELKLTLLNILGVMKDHYISDTRKKEHVIWLVRKALYGKEKEDELIKKQIDNIWNMR